MNVNHECGGNRDVGAAVNKELLSNGLETLKAFQDQIDQLDATLENLASVADPKIEKKARKLQQQLHATEPSVTMIGQIKAGKTSLVNAMIASPDLLPADVNPWTSVVTSLHVNSRESKDNSGATFKFFDLNEWDRLVENGGRIGELASRAGADEELEKVKYQIDEMRQKTRSRLGSRFELLLGQEHKYESFDDELIKRYVCLGDDAEEEDGLAEKQGQFADITKSADLHLNLSVIPTALCIRDTPGVNDTFMMREQITIGAIRDSRTCVVVLSASQALSTMDLALIRLISNVQSRDVIIFVNRIDELSDPAKQVPEIRASIVETLKNNNGPADSKIIFGSAYWANMALAGDLANLSKDSGAAVVNWAEATLDGDGESQSPEELTFELSGLPALYRALSERLVAGPGKETLEKVARGAINLANGIRANSQVLSMQTSDEAAEPLDKFKFDADLEAFEAKMLGALNTSFDEIVTDFSTRIDESHKRFLERATQSLIKHLEINGEDEVWQYSPMGLRVLLRSTYQVFGKRATSSSKQIFAESASEISELYKKILNVAIEDFHVEAPMVPHVPPPVSLGQTIALDLQSSWWKGWWVKRRGYQSFASSFSQLISAETASMVHELKVVQAAEIRERTVQALKEFLSEQREILADLAKKPAMSADELEELFGIRAQEERREILESALAELNQFAA